MTDIGPVENEVLTQLHSRQVGYLLGAGSSCLDGSGYPLASEVWSKVRDDVCPADRRAIEEKLDQGATGLEQALDLLDEGRPDDFPLRQEITRAIARHFRTIVAPLDVHCGFVRALQTQASDRVHVFSLNYDSLLERAADRERIRLVDGFVGTELAFFDQNVFEQCVGLPTMGRRARMCNQVPGIINLYKLHGSLGWYESPEAGARRCSYLAEAPAGSKLLMVPPQRRKAADTGIPPYSSLWTLFRARLIHGRRLVNRLVTIGYGYRDEHVNDVIESALGRNDFTLVVLAKDLLDADFTRWSAKPRVIVVTERRCSLYGELGPGHPDLWSLVSLPGRMAQNVQHRRSTRRQAH